mmetsp:Transcript_11376/g.13028  ORF Transcript_11376/g.13028 Transcript_11376/m.13028 type:complete len:385 (-) Transcript_11376:548-1702(-)|eukprot:CAMPEP_0184009738 /NCGR_PEP_ID=MMETSP0954-20121128/2790_1 /TAXON_ID=627963 /ORGANISM="Aplanochytrium sp, Strain PBS07" /LENGTH=384 /DNA_ID=CAMNT_0026289181 /DNA_START=323 /DNA_END=1477 /DNA_ORIENTATION=+
MAEQADLEDSNMANYGGEDHRNAAKAAAQTEKEFVGAGQKVGIEVWRVENRRTENDTPDFGVKRWPKDQYGEFYDGDSYIVLNTYKMKDPETGKVTDALAWDVHFWLGKDTSIDERGVAAYKTVELDDLLDDGPVQHRETMENESALFQSYFKGGIQYLSGGIESGFRKVKPEEYVPRLLQVRRTKRTTKATQVDTSISAMNKGDCFILDLGPQVIKYLGPDASPFEKSAAANLVSSIVGGRQGKSKEVSITSSNAFWETVGGDENSVPSAEEGNKKADPSLDVSEVKLFRISDASGQIEFTFQEKADAKGYTTAQLDSGDVFVVDSGIEIFIWRGSGASKKEKSQAWKLVDRYMEENDRPSTIPVTVIDEGKVNVVFKSSFAF